MANRIKGITVEIGGDTTGLDKALKNTNNAIRDTQSQLRDVEKLLKLDPTNTELLAQKHRLLGDAASSTKEKLATLREAQRQLDAQIASGSEVNQKQYDALQREIIETEASLDSLTESADKNGRSFEGVGKALKTAGVALGAVAAAAGTAAVKLGKEVVGSYSEYEQLVGGVETLFGTGGRNLEEYAVRVGKSVDDASSEFHRLKEAESTVLENANRAYKTAGLSANDYIDTVTSFSASLIASLNGDTVEAAKLADQAITDMSDNANKMGTDISSIQNAYQGFAKQNYTMLDNLKLGYGGTKEEMARLLEDAEAISGIHYDVSSYADVVSAIHVIQESMDIAGTTAKEAEGTISGSISMLQASITNLITGMGSAESDMGQLAQNVADPLALVIQNITPVVDHIVAAIPSAFETLLAAMMALLPTLLETVVMMFSSVLSMLVETIPQLVPVIVDAVLLITQALIDNLPMIMEAAMQIILALALGLSDALPELTPTLVETVVAIVNGLVNNIPLLIEAALTLMVALGTGLIKAIPHLVKNIPTIIKNMVTAFTNCIGQIKTVGGQLITGLWNGISDKVSWIYKQISGFANGVVSKIKSIFGIHSPSKVMAGIGENLALGLGEGWERKLKTISGSITASMSDIADPDTAVTQPVGNAVTTNNYYSTSDRPLRITVQSVLDGRIIGETAHTYSGQRAKVYGT